MKLPSSFEYHALSQFETGDDYYRRVLWATAKQSVFLIKRKRERRSAVDIEN